MVEVGLQVGTRRLEDDESAALGIDREADPAASGSVNLARDAIAVDFGARLEGWRWSKPGDLLAQPAAAGLGKIFDGDDLHRQVVGAAAPVGFRDDRPSRIVEVAARLLDCPGDECALDVLVDAVGG